MNQISRCDFNCLDGIQEAFGVEPITKQQTPEMGNAFLFGIDTWDGRLALVVSSGFYYPPISPIIKTQNGGALWEKKFTCNTLLWKVTFIKD